MPACRKSHDQYARRINTICACATANDPYGTLGILQRRVRSGLPALMWQAVAQHVHSCTLRRKVPGAFKTLLVNDYPFVATARDDQDG